MPMLGMATVLLGFRILGTSALDDHRLVVLLVDDGLEGEIAQPARRLRWLVQKPLIILETILVRCTVRFPDAADRHYDVVHAADVELLLAAGLQRHPELVDEPSGIPMLGGCVESVGIAEDAHHGEIVQRLAGLIAGRFDHRSQPAA
jgi:hypothetical protein